MRKYSYRAFDAAGKKSDFAMPRAWTPREVAEKLRESLVFLRVPTGSGVHALGYRDEDVHMTGPCVVLVGAKDRESYHVGTYLPQTDAEAHELWKKHVQKI